MDDRFAVARKIADGNKAISIYLDLCRLKDDLEALIRDLMVLTQGKQIVYMIDDVLLRAYAAMNENNRRSFAYPITANSLTDAKLLEKRGTEYTLRLHELLIKPIKEHAAHRVYFPQSLKENLNSHESYFRNIKEKNDTSFKAQVEEKSKNHPGFTPDWKQIEEVIEDCWKEIQRRPPVWDSSQSSLPIQKTGSNANLPHAIYQLLGDYVRKIYQKVVTKTRFEKIKASEYILFNQNVFLEYLKKILGEGEELPEPEKTNGTYLSAHLMELYGFFLSQGEELGIHPISDQAPEQRIEKRENSISNFYSMAVVLGELLEWNALLINHPTKSTQIEVQLVTHRHLTLNMLNSTRLSRHGVPVRHPKFLAGRIPERLRNQVIIDTNRLLTLLDRFLDRIRRNSTSFQQDLEDFQTNFKRPWVAFKNLIYVSENFSKSIPNPNIGPEELNKLTRSDLQNNLEILIRRTLILWNDTPPNIIIHSVKERKDPETKKIIEPKHIMIMPVAGRLRYIVKLNESSFEDSYERKSKLHSIEGFTKFANKIKHKQVAQAVFAAILGQWDAVASVLSTNNKQKVDLSIVDESIVAEKLYLRQFGERGAAARVGGRLRICVHMYKANQSIIGSLELRKSDYRFRLSYLGWHLEMNYFYVKRKLSIYSDDACDLPSIKNPLDSNGPPFLLQQTHELAWKAIEIHDEVQQKMKNFTKSNKKIAEDPQYIYWKYMSGRAMQLLFMILAVVKHNCVWDANNANIELFYGKNRIRLDKILSYLEELGDFSGHFPNAENPNDCNSNYLSSGFLYYWAEYFFKWKGSTQNPSDIDALLKTVTELLTYKQKMELYCKKLPERGFPRELFLYVKKDIFTEMDEKMRDLQESYFTSSRDMIDSTIKRKQLMYGTAS